LNLIFSSRLLRYRMSCCRMSPSSSWFLWVPEPHSATGGCGSASELALPLPVTLGGGSRTGASVGSAGEDGSEEAGGEGSGERAERGGDWYWAEGCEEKE
jgi:hypothetical protein